MQLTLDVSLDEQMNFARTKTCDKR